MIIRKLLFSQMRVLPFASRPFSVLSKDQLNRIKKKATLTKSIEKE